MKKTTYNLYTIKDLINHQTSKEQSLKRSQKLKCTEALAQSNLNHRQRPRRPDRNPFHQCFPRGRKYHPSRRRGRSRESPCKFERRGAPAISWRYKLVELCAKSQSPASCDQRDRSRRLRHRQRSQPQPRGRTSEIDNTSGCPSWKTSPLFNSALSAPTIPCNRNLGKQLGITAIGRRGCVCTSIFCVIQFIFVTTRKVHRERTYLVKELGQVGLSSDGLTISRISQIRLEKN